MVNVMVCPQLSTHSKLVFESPGRWTEKRPKPNQVGLFAARLSVGVAEGLGKWQLQSAPDLENS